MIEVITVILFGLLVVTAIAAIRLHDLFAVVMIFSIYSLLAAAIFVAMDAVDVAFTEAAVGVGISTVLMLATIGLVGRDEKRPAHMPHFGDPLAPIHQHVAPHYLQESPMEIGIPNVVTEVLASYRGYDTLGELTVIFTAGIGVLALLGIRRRKRDES